MNQQQVEAVIKVLSEQVEENNQYIMQTDDLSDTLVESINNESATCIEAIAFLKTIHSYLQKWSQQLKIDGVNSKSMVLNDIKFLLKEKN